MEKKNNLDFFFIFRFNVTSVTDKEITNKQNHVTCLFYLIHGYANVFFQHYLMKYAFFFYKKKTL